MNVRNRRAYLRVIARPAWPPNDERVRTDYAISDDLAYMLLEGIAHCELVFIDVTPREYATTLEVKLPEE